MDNILDDIKNCKHENYFSVGCGGCNTDVCPDCGATTTFATETKQYDWDYPTIFHKYIQETKPPEPPKEPPLINFKALGQFLFGDKHGR